MFGASETLLGADWIIANAPWFGVEGEHCRFCGDAKPR